MSVHTLGYTSSQLRARRGERRPRLPVGRDSRYAKLMILSTIPSSTLHALQWPALIEAIARRCCTPMGRERCAQLGPLSSRAEVELNLHSVAELRERVRDDSLPGMAAIHDLRELLDRARQSAPLSGAELMQIAHSLDAICELRQALTSSRDNNNHVRALALQLSESGPLAHAILRTFDAAGEIVDGASAALAELRRQMRRLRERCQSALDDIQRRWSQAGVLQDDYVTQRGERYVLPVRSDRRGEAGGLVLDTSNTGRTLFVQPQALLDLGNQLTIAEAAVRDEERRILLRLTQRVLHQAEALWRDMDLCGEIDSLCAQARVAELMEAEAPEISEHPSLRLSQARHPLLLLAQSGDDDAVIASDIELDGEARVLLISGPNAGGKTVALKTAGLCALMLRAGMPIPAQASSCLSLFDAIYAVVGDAQSLDDAQSTFSSQVLTIDAMLRSLRAAKPLQALCLIDEIAHGTDAQQGACLGQALLEALVDRGAWVVCTTHYDRLKVLALEDRRFRNASVALDAAGLRPTYRLSLDSPGSSSAFAIATHLGLPADVVARARELAGPASAQLDAHLDDLTRQRETLRCARLEHEQQLQELAQQREQVEQKQRRLDERERQLRRDAFTEALGDVRRARREVAQIIQELQRGPRDGRNANQAAQGLLRIERQVQGRLSADSASGSPPSEDLLRPGQRVFVASLDQSAEIIESKKKHVLVQVGSLRCRVKREELRPCDDAPPDKKKKTRPGAGPARVQLRLGERRRSPRHPGNTLDLRGQRVDQALQSCEIFLDRMLQSNESTAYLLHGHGTNALKQALRRELPASDYVRALRPADPDDGGDAFTVVELS